MDKVNFIKILWLYFLYQTFPPSNFMNFSRNIEFTICTKIIPDIQNQMLLYACSLVCRIKMNGENVC